MARVVLGMIGLGTVGSGVVRLLAQQNHLKLSKVAVLDLKKERQHLPPCPLTIDAQEVLDDPEIEIVIEVMGGEQPALSYLQRAIEKRKHVVTANKEVLAKHGPHLFEAARKRNVAIFFEASVAGGIPLISTIHKGLEANDIASITGILNGTTNFILSSMEKSSLNYDDALTQAQKLGYAEADPANDVDGHDVGYKLSILSALCFERFVNPSEIFREGIRNITDTDIAQAREFGYRIKLVGTSRRGEEGRIDTRVHPMMVALNHPLASVSGANNGIVVNGDAVGEIMMFGPGAGQMPTASAIVGDTMNLASALQLPDFARYFQPNILGEWARTTPAGSWSCPFFLRLSVNDTAGVIGHIGTILGAHGISIESILQRGVAGGKASIVIVTHETKEKNMQSALSELRKAPFLHAISSCIRIFGSGS